MNCHKALEATTGERASLTVKAAGAAPLTERGRQAGVAGEIPSSLSPIVLLILEYCPKEFRFPNRSAVKIATITLLSLAVRLPARFQETHAIITQAMRRTDSIPITHDDDYWTHDTPLFVGNFSSYRMEPRRVQGKVHVSEEPYVDVSLEIVHLVRWPLAQQLRHFPVDAVLV